MSFSLKPVRGTCWYTGDASSKLKPFAMLHGDGTGIADDEMRPRCDSLPDQTAAAAVGSKRKSILKKEALNREEIEGLLSSGGGGGAGSSRNSFATPVDGTPARTAAADNEVDADEDDELVVRHLPRLSDSAEPQRRLHPPPPANQLPTSQSVATIAEFDTDCDEESSVEGELDAGRRLPDSRPRTDSLSGDVPRSREPPRYQYPGCGACGGTDGTPVDNVRSPQNANVPIPQPTDINLNPPPSGGRGVPPPIPARLQAPRPADDLGNHLPNMPLPLDQADTTAFTHNLFPTLDYIDEFAD